VKEIPKIPLEIKENHIKKNVDLMRSKFYNGSILPLSMNLELYGDQLSKLFSMYYILKFDLRPGGLFIENFAVKYFDLLTVNSFLKSSKTNVKLNTNIVTFDIETYVKDGKFIPFACGWFSGDFIKTYYLTDFNSPYGMLLQALSDMLEFNPNAKVYIHNFSNFDYMFLIKVLFENFIVKPLFKDNKLISLFYQDKKKKMIN
jgi:DNA polymerase elongation subunit (family B)